MIQKANPSSDLNGQNNHDQYQRESAIERSVRYMTTLDENRRNELRATVRSYRAANNGARSDHSCDDIIDGAILRLAKRTTETATDYDSAEDLLNAIKRAIGKHFEAKPDRGWAMAE